jgi:hypothetical protein
VSKLRASDGKTLGTFAVGTNPRVDPDVRKLFRKARVQDSVIADGDCLSRGARLDSRGRLSLRIHVGMNFPSYEKTMFVAHPTHVLCRSFESNMRSNWCSAIEYLIEAPAIFRVRV